MSDQQSILTRPMSPEPAVLAAVYTDLVGRAKALDALLGAVEVLDESGERVTLALPAPAWGRLVAVASAPYPTVPEPSWFRRRRRLLLRRARVLLSGR